MIQRKQSIFLAISVVLLILLFVFPVFSFEQAATKKISFIYGLDELQPQFFPLLLLNVFSIILIIAVIFLYKNRKLQMKLCNLATLFVAGLIVGIFYYAEDLKSLPELEGYTSNIRPVLVNPIAALMLVILANRFIKKDEELVRSADRLR